MAPFGAELSFRGKLAQVFSGTHAHTDVVVASFPDRAALEAWHASPAYQALIPLRTAAADVDLMSYDTDPLPAPSRGRIAGALIGGYLLAAIASALAVRVNYAGVPEREISSGMAA
jgi:hypothetical protein